jgi:hypothetical protein
MAANSHPRRRAAVVGPSRSERNLIHRIDLHGQPKWTTAHLLIDEGSSAAAIAVSLKRSNHRHSGQGAESWQAFSYSRPRVDGLLLLKRFEARQCKSSFST